MAKGTLEKKREAMLLCAARSVGLDKETLEKLQQGDVDVVAKVFYAIQLQAKVLLKLTLQKCCHMLSEWDGWGGIANTPRDFERQVSLYTRGASVCLKLMHDVPDHRPSKMLQRDIRLFQMKSANSSVTYEQMAIAYKNRYGEPITRQIIERAYKRQTLRAKKLIDMALLACVETSTVAALPPEERVKVLPTPEDVLRLLTK
jgi:hypothetical protein